jgi:hypothetical protein
MRLLRIALPRTVYLMPKTIFTRRIAMMGKRFDKDSEDTHRIWIFPFANLVLRYERMLSTVKLEKYRSGTAVRCASVKQPRQLPLLRDLLIYHPFTENTS